MRKGYLCIVLHAHLPFVRHPEHPDFLEERWLFEAITETYIPLLNSFERLLSANIKFRLTVSLSPTLISMLTDKLLQQRYLKHLDKMLELASKETARTYNGPFYNTSLMYLEMFLAAKNTFNKYNHNLVEGFNKFYKLGKLELITCAGTHGFLPLMLNNNKAAFVQIKTAVELFKRHFGKIPKGMWLPECAYAKGIDELLKECGVKYFFVDTHGLMFASPRPKYGIFAPVYCPSGVAAFGRDAESSKQVWSSIEGYPGDYDYREFYRDVGFDLDIDYISRYIHPDGIRVNTGIKYHRITGNEHKEPYIPAKAMKKAAFHAADFVLNREVQINHLNSLMDRPPVIVAPYDAELFGHWWFEGPQWLEFVLEKIHNTSNIIELITPGDYLKKHNNNQVSTPCNSSWGNKGYNDVWLQESNAWIYQHLHVAADRMSTMAAKYYHARGLQARALSQAARELMLAQSSDWAFIISNDTSTEYAVNRIKTHLNNFIRLHQQITEDGINDKWVSYLEAKNNIFPDLDFRYYA